MQNFYQNGFSILDDFVKESQLDLCLNMLKRSIMNCADELLVSSDKYVNCTGRWSNQSSIVKPVSNYLDCILQKKLSLLFNKKIRLQKSNVICKTASLIDAIPFHQDISYSKNSPYHFSLWLPFSDVDEYSSPLRVIKSSHHSSVMEAVDFWFPYFIDKHQFNERKIISLPVAKTSAIIFDSKMWHGSDINTKRKERFAYVTRWVIENEDFPAIPDVSPSLFGMFNCGPLSIEILQKSIIFIDKNIDYTSYNTSQLIDLWINFLQENPYIWGINHVSAVLTLRKLDILNKACDLHYAGSISGEIYKTLWYSLLSHLNDKIQLINLNEPYNV